MRGRAKDRYLCVLERRIFILLLSLIFVVVNAPLQNPELYGFKSWLIVEKNMWSVGYPYCGFAKIVKEG